MRHWPKLVPGMASYVQISAGFELFQVSELFELDVWCSLLSTSWLRLNVESACRKNLHQYRTEYVFRENGCNKFAVGSCWGTPGERGLVSPANNLCYVLLTVTCISVVQNNSQPTEGPRYHLAKNVLMFWRMTETAAQTAANLTQSEPLAEPADTITFQLQMLMKSPLRPSSAKL